MSTEIFKTTIKVPHQQLDARLLVPQSPVPGILFVHGWGGSQHFDLKRAHTIAGMGCICLTFDLAGHNANQHEREEVTREQNFQDICAAFDTLSNHPMVDSSSIAIVGHSYGAYLACLLSEFRSVRWLSLLAPALYPDDDWLAPKDQLNRELLQDYRLHTHTPQENRALQACSKFTGDVLLFEAEYDELIPRQTLLTYRQAFSQAHSLTHRVLEGSNHALDEKVAQRDYSVLLYRWIQEMIIGARIGHLPGNAS